ncbi:MAG: hypothetical protein JEZ02_11870 [Desulfatibacillum sp.]|nr:hypothetical protein [Desulfatibacillum sp.]
MENEVVKAIYQGNFQIIAWLIVIAMLQMVISTFIITRIKTSIEHEYLSALERFKDELLRKKIVYEEQLAAYKAFSGLKYNILPKKSHSDMDWGEACDDIATGFSEHYEDIKAFLETYSAILPKKIEEEIESCRTICDDGSLIVPHPPVNIPSDAGNKANELWSKMGSIENAFRSLLKIETDI